MTPVEFLSARYDEREAIARAAIGGAVFQSQTGRWSFEYVDLGGYGIPFVFALADGGGKTQVADLSAAWSSAERGAHITANDPAAVLADIAAKRVILEACRQVQDHHISDDFTADSLADAVLAQLMAPFAAHPDFDPGWLA